MKKNINYDTHYINGNQSNINGIIQVLCNTGNLADFPLGLPNVTQVCTELDFWPFKAKDMEKF